METLGYVYNRTAAAMREKKRRLVGVVVTTFQNPFLAQSLQAIEVELERLGYNAIISSSLGNVSRQEQALQTMKEFGVAGVILAAVEDTAASTAKALEESGIACLSYTRYDENVDYVGPDDIAGGRLAARHLLDHGVDSIAFLGYKRPASASHLRQAGIEAELTDAGRADTLELLVSEDGPSDAYELGRELARRKQRPDGIICVSDTTAIGLMRALHDGGVREFPRIIGFDDIEFAKFSIPSLTTISSDPDGTGRLAAQLLTQRVEDRRHLSQTHYSESRLVVRDSCGCSIPLDE